MNIHKYIKNKGFKRIKTTIPCNHIDDNYDRKISICDIDTLIKDRRSNKDSYTPIYPHTSLYNISNDTIIDLLKNVASYKLDLDYIIFYINISKNSHYIFTNLIVDQDYWTIDLKGYSNNSFNYDNLESYLPTDVMKRNFSIENILK